MSPITIEQEAASHLIEAINLLKSATPSRECSVAITNLETSLMWLNKDRTIKGELKPYPTHTKGGEE